MGERRDLRRRMKHDIDNIIHTIQISEYMEEQARKRLLQAHQEALEAQSPQEKDHFIRQAEKEREEIVRRANIHSNGLERITQILSGDRDTPRTMFLSEVVGAAVGFFEEAEREISFTYTREGAPRVYANPLALRSVMDNILRNAITATKKVRQREIFIHQYVGSRPEETPIRGAFPEDITDWATVTVRDHGPGFPEEVLEQIAKGAYSDPERGERLGFKIILDTLAENDGYCVAFSRDPGATVSVYLPSLSDLSAASRSASEPVGP